MQRPSDPSSGGEVKNMQKNVLAILAIGFVAVLFGSMVSAAVIELNPSNVSVNKANGKPILAEHQDILKSVRERLAQVDEDVKVKFKDSYKLVRKHIAEYRKDKDFTLTGWSVQRLVNATDLSNEQKRSLMNAMASYREEKNNGSYERRTVLFWNVEESYMAYGKMGAVVTEDGMVGKGIGFNNMTKQRFAFVWGNGVFAGLQNGNVFWGTYDSQTHSARMNFGDGSTMLMEYSISE